MIQGQPLYSIADQYTKLGTTLPSNFNTINNIRFRLLMACSKNGNIDSAKNRFLSLIQDTEVNSLFSSILERPLEKEHIGLNSLQTIHNKMKSQYGLFDLAVKELGVVGIPVYTIDCLNRYFYGNEDPIYKLSILAAVVMLAYVKDDAINNVKE